MLPHWPGVCFSFIPPGPRAGSIFVCLTTPVGAVLLDYDGSPELGTPSLAQCWMQSAHVLESYGLGCEF